MKKKGTFDPRNKLEHQELGSGRTWPEIIRGNSDEECCPLIRERRHIFSTPYQKIYQVTAKFDGFIKEFFVNEYRDRAGLVVDRNGEILLVRQYRLMIDGISWEIPGGAVDDDENSKQAAVRECLEETGVRCFNPKRLLYYHMGLDTLYSPHHIFYTTEVAEELEPNSVHTQEVTGFDWIPLERCLDMVFNQQIVDSFSVAALMAYHTWKCRQGDSLKKVNGSK